MPSRDARISNCFFNVGNLVVFTDKKVKILYNTRHVLVCIQIETKNILGILVDLNRGVAKNRRR